MLKTPSVNKWWNWFVPLNKPCHPILWSILDLNNDGQMTWANPAPSPEVNSWRGTHESWRGTTKLVLPNLDPSPSQLGGLGERCMLPQRGPSTILVRFCMKWKHFVQYDFAFINIYNIECQCRKWEKKTKYATYFLIHFFSTHEWCMPYIWIWSNFV